MPSELTEEEESLDGTILCGCGEHYLRVVIRNRPLSFEDGEQYQRSLRCPSPNCGYEESLDERL